MPARSQAQHRMMAEDLEKARRGEQTRTGMTIEQLEEYVNTPNVHELPERAEPKKKPAQKRYVY
jgi:hypothetical protein